MHFGGVRLLVSVVLDGRGLRMNVEVVVGHQDFVSDELFV
jgi:hypothetical protein